jgi:5-methylcytosine-specific restriction protein A
MPSLPRRVCSHPGCHALAGTGGRCTRHPLEERKAWASTTTSSTARGYGRAWQARRRVVLARDPICKLCNRAPSTEVDHIKPKRRGGGDELENLQGACTPCHRDKTERDKRVWASPEGQRRGGRPGGAVTEPNVTGLETGG